MAITIANVRVRSYENIVRHLAQQGISRLRPWVMEKAVNSEAHNWETQNTVDTALKATTGRVDTPFMDTPWDRRISRPRVHHVADSVEIEDPSMMIVDPNSNIAHGQGMAMKRTFDDVIIDAVTGTAENNTDANIAFPTSQIIGDYTTDFDFDLVTQVTEKFMANDIDPDIEKVFVISPAFARKLLQLTEATSGDYNALRPLTSKGYVESWMGYSWLVSTRLNSPANDQRDIFAMSKKAIGLQVNQDISSKVGQDPTRSFMWIIYSHANIGAVRVEDKHVVWVKAEETGAVAS